MADETDPSSTPGPPPAPKDNGFIPGDDGWTRTRNWFRILTKRMTAEGMEEYRVTMNKLHEERDCRKCEEHRDFLLKYSPIVRFLRTNIQNLSPDSDINSTNIRCRRCDKRQNGGFEPGYGILICANEMRNQGHVEDTIAHEMVHAYDHLRFKVERSNLRHQACTEVRGKK
ncbi:MAG: Mitochondrial inner membrane protease atp23 [Sarea resinae]|nr:MAG: Mitochondrial inner membrane protease atp23 [Sarea resinae]